MKAIATSRLFLAITLVVTASIASLAAAIVPLNVTQAQGPAPLTVSSDPSLDGREDLGSQGVAASPGDAQGILAAADALERFFRVNGESTFGSSVFPLADGFLVFTGHGQRLNVTKLDPSGDVAFSKDLNCGANGWFKSIAATPDGGYLLGGLMNTSPQYGFVLKLGSDLACQWSKRFDSLGHAWVDGARPTVDGGSLVLVRDASGFGVVKLDASQEVEWQKRLYLGSAGNQTAVYDIYENTYLDGSSQPHCGGIVLFGGVQNTTADSDWDLVLAALSCDGNALLWQRQIGGADWEGSYVSAGGVSDRAGGIVLTGDHNGTNTQDADLVVVATTESFGTQRSALFAPFHISGTTTLSTTVTIGSIQDLDSPGNDSVRGNYGGPSFIPLSDGNLLLAGHTDFPGASVLGVFLVKMQPDLDLLWQTLYGTYDTLNCSVVSESAAGLQVTGTRYALPGGEAALFMQVSPDGENSGEYLARETGDFTMTVVSPAITTPSFTLDGGTLQVADQTCTTEDTTAWLIHPSRAHLPVVLKPF
jgi:hypothetical protein